MAGNDILKDHFQDLVNYINWADHLAITWLEQINDEQWNQVVISSFGSVRQTAIHIAGAKKIWLNFWKNEDDPVYLSAEFTGTKDKLIAIWKQASADVKDLIDNYPAKHYNAPINIIKPNGEQSTMEFRKTLPHMVNHGTYHRGQLVTLLRQAGFTGFSNTDLFTYYRLQLDKS